MVAHSGRGWKLAPALIALEDEANRLAPRRSKGSDGSIGDLAHQARDSDHNPSGGFVYGIDLTHDPRGGFDAHAHVRDIARRKDPRVKYLISLGQFWKPDGKGWRTYTGSNRHDKHAHVSLLSSARNNLSPWLRASPAAAPAPDWAALRRYAAGVLATRMSQQPNLNANSPAGLRVVALQQALNLASGAGLSENGVYDQPTMQAVANFQSYFNGIKPGAIRDPNGAAMEGTRFFLVLSLQRIRDGLAA